MLGKTATPGVPVSSSALGAGGNEAYSNKLASASERADAQAASTINEAMDNMACSVVSDLLCAHFRRCRAAGKYGWYSYKACSHIDLRVRLQECAARGDWLGVLAYAAFLLMRQRLGID